MWPMSGSEEITGWPRKRLKSGEAGLCNGKMSGEAGPI